MAFPIRIQAKCGWAPLKCLLSIYSNSLGGDPMCCCTRMSTSMEAGATEKVPMTIRWLLMASDEEFESGVQDLDVRELLQLISHLQNEMSIEQKRFDQLSELLREERERSFECGRDETDNCETASLSSALCRSQIRLAQLCTRNMRCFTQQAIRAQQERNERQPQQQQMNAKDYEQQQQQFPSSSILSGRESPPPPLPPFLYNWTKKYGNSVPWASPSEVRRFDSSEDEKEEDPNGGCRDKVQQVPSVQDILQSVRELRLSGVAGTQLVLKTQNGGDNDEREDEERRRSAAARPNIPSPDYNSDEEEDVDTSISTTEDKDVHWRRNCDKDEQPSPTGEDDSLSSHVSSDPTPPSSISRSILSCPELVVAFETKQHKNNDDDEHTKNTTSHSEKSYLENEDEDDDDDSGVGADEGHKRHFGRRQRERSSLFDHIPNPPPTQSSGGGGGGKNGYSMTTLATNNNESQSLAPTSIVEEEEENDDEEVIPSIIDQFDSSPAGQWERSLGEMDGRQKRTNVFWNPQQLLDTIYRVPEPLAPTNPPANYINMEGYLDKLPSGRRQATYWNAWKRRYFRLKDGYLYCYPNAKSDEANFCYQLMGGRVDTVESSLLGIDDGKGHYVVVRCGNRSDTERWRRAILTQTAENYSQTYAQPVPPYPQFFEDVILIDIGSSSVRAGILCNQPTLPQVYFPTVSAKDRTTGRTIYGTAALNPNVRKGSTISFPLKPSAKITKFTVDFQAVTGLLTKVFSDLNVDPSDYQVQLSLPRSFPFKSQTEVLDLLMTEFGVRAVNLTAQTVLALCSYNSTSGVVVDIGERIEVVPIVDGYIVELGLSRIPYGGSRLLDHLRHFLMQRHCGLVSEMDSFLLRYVLENACFCAEHYRTELQRFHSDPKSYEMSVSVAEFFDGEPPWETITLDSGRFQVPEGLFNPDAWGLDNPGIHKLVSKAIQECALDARKEMSRSIFLSGGVTMLPGFAQRLEAEMNRLTPPTVTPKVHASPYRAHAAYLGACIWASGAGFHQAKITRNDWVANGSACLKKWHF